MKTIQSADGVTVHGTVTSAFEEILCPDALRFLGTLAREFEEKRLGVLYARKIVNVAGHGRFPDFLAETENIRNSQWKIAPIPEDLRDRRVEITGPVDRKMVINALNSGAKTFMADFEDSHSPTWENTIEGQINLRDAANRKIEFTAPGGKEYRLNRETAVLIVRPRGWHLIEKHVRVDGKPVSASIFDFSLFFFHNAKTLLKNGSGPYFYIPKLESHLEARLWNEIFLRAQEMMGIPSGTIKATVLIETLPAAFEMDEILYELKDHVAGLNCGRWDYIFSFIKKFRNIPAYIFPDRAQITMTRHCMRSYSLLAIQTCHKRGAHAIGGMAAQIPIRDDPKANEAALLKVRDDKIREAEDGHDGTWVAHPGLVSVAMEPFDRLMPGPNQIDRLRDDVTITRDDLLKLPKGDITEHGLRTNVNVGIQYLASWLSGNGCVPLYHLMEDAATAEISRTQVWHWIHNPNGRLADGRKITPKLFREILNEEMEKIRENRNSEVPAENYETACGIFEKFVSQEELEDFLTTEAYNHLT